MSTIAAEESSEDWYAAVETSEIIASSKKFRRGVRKEFMLCLIRGNVSPGELSLLISYKGGGGQSLRWVSTEKGYTLTEAWIFGGARASTRGEWDPSPPADFFVMDFVVFSILRSNSGTGKSYSSSLDRTRSSSS